MYDDPKSKISQLEKVLDSREDKVSKKIKRHELHSHESDIPQDWSNTVGSEVSPLVDSDEESEKKRFSLSLKVLLSSVIFFVLALLIVLYKFIGGSNIVSGDNIAVTVKAPVSIAGGEILPLEIEVRNNNGVALVGADLGITFPVGAMQADNLAMPAKRSQIYLGDIAPGKSVVKNVKVALYGSENEKKTFSLNLEYKVAGSNSLFNKTKDVVVLVSSAPVSLTVSGPTQINANQNVSFTATVTSNSTSVIKNLLLKADYPFGFTFSNSSPLTFSKNNLWLIGDLAPGEKRVITVNGNVTGQEGEERGFNFSLGTQSAADATVLETPFTSSFSSVTIRRPFVSADIFFNGSDAKEYISNSGDKIEAVIKWQNNLPYQVSDVSIVVGVSGNALDKSAIQVDDGFYRSYDNTIVFDKTTNSTFARLDPGQSGESKFIIKSFNVSSVTGSALINPVISLSIAVQGKSLSGSGNQNISFVDSRKIKITSTPRIFAKSLYYVGPFQNKGPVPPKAETETTYTVTWTVTNPLNNLSGARVVTTLPPYMKWLGVISPENEKISYDANTNQIIWSVGNVLAGAGSVSPAREVSFQLSFLPSVSQIGTAPNLIGEAMLTARDTFTSTNVSYTFGAVNTKLSSDPYFNPESDNVVR